MVGQNAQSAVGIILREGSAVNHAVFPHHNPIGNTAVHAQNGDACIINIRLCLVRDIFPDTHLHIFTDAAFFINDAMINQSIFADNRACHDDGILHHCPLFHHNTGDFALAHNGTLVNTNSLRARLIDDGIQLRSGTDSEVAAKAIGDITKKTHHLREGIRFAMEHLKGAYAMVLASPDCLYAFRDPNGIRPLCMGKLPDDRGWVVSSETCGLDIVGAEYVRDVNPGEIVRFSKDGVTSEQGVPAGRRASCIFEYVYFARPDSVMDGQSVYQARRNMGRILAREAPADADLVLGVPDSGIPSAMGFAFESGIPYADGIVKNRYVGRTFIQPTQAMRQLGIRLKLNPLPSVISGKRLVVIDDSIVRGNTSKKLIEMLRQAGATEVHLRIVSPEVLWPCFYGIDTDTRDQLIAANMTNEEMCEWMGADSLAFISLQGLRDSLPDVRTPGYCEACFSGDYPVEIPPSTAKKSFMTKADFAAEYARESEKAEKTQVTL